MEFALNFNNKKFMLSNMTIRAVQTLLGKLPFVLLVGRSDLNTNPRLKMQLSQENSG